MLFRSCRASNAQRTHKGAQAAPCERDSRDDGEKTRTWQDEQGNADEHEEDAERDSHEPSEKSGAFGGLRCRSALAGAPGVRVHGGPETGLPVAGCLVAGCGRRLACLRAARGCRIRMQALARAGDGRHVDDGALFSLDRKSVV